LSKNPPPPPPPGFKHTARHKKKADLPPPKHKIFALAFPKETAIARQTTEVVVGCCLFGFESLLKSSAKGNKVFFFKKKEKKE